MLSITAMLKLQKDKTISEIISCLSDENFNGCIDADGSLGAFANCLACLIQKQTDRTVVLISGHIEDADKADEDFLAFGSSAINLPAWDGGKDLCGNLDEVAAARFKAVSSIKAAGNHSTIINAPIQAICQPIFDLEDENACRIELYEGQVVEPQLLEGSLIEEGFERLDCVDMPGQFARRGGIVDVFAPIATYRFKNGSSDTAAAAVRIDFFGDTIESMRLINPDNQHSTEYIDAIEIYFGNNNRQTLGKKSLFDILPKNSVIIFNEPTIIQETAELFASRLGEDSGIFQWQELYRKAARFARLQLSRFDSGICENPYRLPIVGVDAFTAKGSGLWQGHKQNLADLAEQAKNGKKVFLYCENAANRKRVQQIITDVASAIPKNIKLYDTTISGGFEITTLGTIVISHHELFGQDTISRPMKSLKPAAAIDSFLDLAKGDYVVHIGHGIGKFNGISSIEKQGQTFEYLTIEFANKSFLKVPVSSIGLVHKYVGAAALSPKLSVLGGKKWQNQKQQVAEAVNDMAVELLETQAKRQRAAGIAFAKDTPWQQSFEQSFPYQETADQITAMEQIKKHMEAAKPMDMLICGDVGYGKTELAMRAAFKAVQSGKQVAVLVPTTVLCVQHGRTFTERFADFPVNIEIINRFKSPAEAAKTAAATAQGKIDILIGTHRLLSKDITFKDLGLLIIDEEQRFGVSHKEKLKKMRVEIDVLTLTATPIPRTLHLSLIGLRDIAALSTPPLDRRSVATSVNRRSKEVIKTVINRELSREGQVFFLHNRVNSIDRVANELRELFPDVAIKVAHGQMPKHRLEDAMLEFVSKRADVLVCTTIIESGLDIPTANTIIIDNADTFGLSQLHQLRGRVGRYKYRAYAQLMLPPNRAIRPIAARRLKAIEEYSQLGAGFKIALRDLEIRGAGNILGQEQSGHINLVGYELYCRLLSDAVGQLKGEKIQLKPQPVINLGFAGTIPISYIESPRQRMAAYRKIAAAETIEDLKNIENEFKDIFGTPPQQVLTLLDMADIRVRAASYSITGINIIKNDLVLTFADQLQSLSDVSIAEMFLNVKEKITIPDSQTIHLKLTPTHFEPKTILAKLRLILK